MTPEYNQNILEFSNQLSDLTKRPNTNLSQFNFDVIQTIDELNYTLFNGIYGDKLMTVLDTKLSTTHELDNDVNTSWSNLWRRFGEYLLSSTFVQMHTKNMSMVNIVEDFVCSYCDIEVLWKVVKDELAQHYAHLVFSDESYQNTIHNYMYRYIDFAYQYQRTMTEAEITTYKELLLTLLKNRYSRSIALRFIMYIHQEYLISSITPNHNTCNRNELLFASSSAWNMYQQKKPSKTFEEDYQHLWLTVTTDWIKQFYARSDHVEHISNSNYIARALIYTYNTYMNILTNEQIITLDSLLSLLGYQDENKILSYLDINPFSSSEYRLLYLALHVYTYNLIYIQKNAPTERISLHFLFYSYIKQINMLYLTNIFINYYNNVYGTVIGRQDILNYVHDAYIKLSTYICFRTLVTLRTKVNKLCTETPKRNSKPNPITFISNLLESNSYIKQRSQYASTGPIDGVLFTTDKDNQCYNIVQETFLVHLFLTQP